MLTVVCRIHGKVFFREEIPCTGLLDHRAEDLMNRAMIQ